MAPEFLIFGIIIIRDLGCDFHKLAFLYILGTIISVLAIRICVNAKCISVFRTWKPKEAFKMSEDAGSSIEPYTLTMLIADLLEEDDERSL